MCLSAAKTPLLNVSNVMSVHTLRKERTNIKEKFLYQASSKVLFYLK